MLRNRWIRIPLLIAAWWITWQLLFGLFDTSQMRVWPIIIGGLFFGFAIEGFSWLRVRFKYGKVGPTALDPRQKRSLTLMQEKGQSLETCKAAVESISNMKLRGVDANLSRIRFRSKTNWASWGNHFTIYFREVGEHLTEVSIESKPIIPTVIVDSGEAWKTIDQIVSEIKKLDSQPSKEALNDGAEMLQDLTMRPIKVRR